jgi:hypothetical protein
MSNADQTFVKRKLPGVYPNFLRRYLHWLERVSEMLGCTHVDVGEKNAYAAT